MVKSRGSLPKCCGISYWPTDSLLLVSSSLALLQMCLFILLSKYLDSTYYMPGAILSALQVNSILITLSQVGTIIILTDDNTV